MVAPAGEPHTAPQDEIVTVVSELMRGAPGRGVTIDMLANALKSRGFRRTPGSPRLITRLRRIRDLTIDRGGFITLVGNGDRAPRSGDEPPTPESSADEVSADETAHPEPPPPALTSSTAEMPPSRNVEPAASDGPDDEDGDDAPGIGNERFPEQRPASRPAQDAGGRRRSRRGGRRHRRRREGSGSGQPV